MTGKIFGLEVIQIQGQNKITFLYILQFVSKLKKWHSNILITVCIVSQSIHVSTTQKIYEIVLISP